MDVSALSMEQQVALLSPEDQLLMLEGLDPDELLWDWAWGARPQQYLDPFDESWAVALLLAGRGSGKTRGTTEWVRDEDKHWADMPERHGLGADGLLRGALLSRTAADVRDTLINGPSGLLHIYPPSQQDLIEWIPSRRLLILPNGSEWLTFSAEEPDQLRGPAFNLGVADELAAYKGKPGADGLTAWDNLRIATRIGRTPQIVAATTPKRVPLMRKLVQDASDPAKRIMVRKMRTMDNPYLSLSYLDVLDSLYGGTTLGAQELDGEMLDEVAGAMVKSAFIDKNRVTAPPDEWTSNGWYRVLAVDPSVAEKPTDECGIMLITAPKAVIAHKRHAWVLEDYTIYGSPAVWGERAVKMAALNNATIVVESNQGGAMAKLVMEQIAAQLNLPKPMIRMVWASTNKKARAEPVGVAYEKGRVHHVNILPEYETQITEWTKDSGYSPDRMDAGVWGLSSVLLPQVMKNGLPGGGTATSANHAGVRRVATKQTSLQRAGARGGRYGR